MMIRLDPWPAEYESAFQIDELEPDSGGKVYTDVEHLEWRAVESRPASSAGPLHFVDGVRRVETRIIFDDATGRIIRGLFGSFAVGSVCVQENAACFHELRVERRIVVGAGVALGDQVIADANSVKVGNCELTFEPVDASDNKPAAATERLQNCMREAEARLAEELSSESACVFADGPLTYFVGINQTAVGVVKRLVEPYLAAPQFDLVRRLKPGQRTPLFMITKGTYDRYSCYLRVGEPRGMDHDVAGVLRLEMRTGLGIEKSIELAELASRLLPNFTGEAFRDPRAPQNLMPIGALESELRHRLGDPLTIRRAIEARLFQVSQ